MRCSTGALLLLRRWWCLLTQTQTQTQRLTGALWLQRLQQAGVGARRPSSRRWTRARPSCVGRPTMVRMGRAARCAGTAGAGAGAAAARRCLTIPRPPFWDSYSSGSRAGVVRRRGLVVIKARMGNGQRTADSAAPGHSLHVASCRPLLHDVRVSPTHHQSCLVPATIHCQWLLETRLDVFSFPWTALHATAPISDRLCVAVKHIYRHGI